MATETGFRFRKKHVIAILLAGFGGFFVIQRLTTAPTYYRTQAQTQTAQSRAQPLAAAPKTDGEDAILARLSSVMDKLRWQADRIKDPTARSALLLSDQPPVVATDSRSPAGRESQAVSSATPGTSLSTGSTGSAVPQPQSSATLSPFIPSSRVSIAGVARIVVEDLNVSAFVDAQQQRSLTVQMRAANRGTAASTANTPMKFFMTMASGNSMLLGEHLIPPLEPNASVEKKATYQCPESGTAQVCITIPAEFSVTSTGSAETTVCKSVTVPEVPATAASSTSSPSPAAASSGTHVMQDSDCLCSRR